MAGKPIRLLWALVLLLSPFVVTVFVLLIGHWREGREERRDTLRQGEEALVFKRRGF